MFFSDRYVSISNRYHTILSSSSWRRHRPKPRFYDEFTISYKEESPILYTTFYILTNLDCHMRDNAWHTFLERLCSPSSWWFTSVSYQYILLVFESRKDPLHAPLAIWLNGVPGASSTASALGENGPCTVQEDSNSTELNPCSRNNEVNMLYIDRPVQFGFSYGSLANGTLDALSTTLLHVISDFSTSGVPEQNETFFVGTFPSLN